MKNIELYVLDTETTGLDPAEHSPIEISIYRLSNDDQKTWWLRPLRTDNISEDALRVNKHKLEDITGKTEFGKNRYQDPTKVLVEIENWIMGDFCAAEDRIMTGQNVGGFDKGMMEALWKKCGSPETYPFNRKYVVDTMTIELFQDLCAGQFAEGYSLFALARKYSIRNEKAHSAASDVLTTVGVLKKQMENYKKLVQNQPLKK